jgi:hypothetical protein
MAVPARAELILDQQMDPTGKITLSAGFGAATPNTFKLAQTFQVGVSGQLAEVDLLLQRFSSPLVGEVFVELRATTPAGVPVPDPAFLAQVQLPAAAIPNAPNPGTFINVDLRPFNLQVLAGEQLALVVYANALGSSYFWLGSSEELYAPGRLFTEQPPGLPWVGSLPNFDGGFRTYVETGTSAVIPEPASAALLGVGLLVLAAHRRWQVKISD